MKKWLKISLITVSSLLALVVIVVGVACYLVLTPARLTSLVNSLSERFVTCEARFERVELTVVKTFPNVGVDIRNVMLVNPQEGAPNDTLATVDNLVLGLNLKQLLSNKDIIVNEVLLNGVYANLYVDANGNANYNIFASDSTETPSDSSSTQLGLLDIKKVKLSNLNCKYVDEAQHLDASLQKLALNVSGSLADSALTAKVDLSLPVMSLLMSDTVAQPVMNVELNELDISASAHGTTALLNGKIDCSVADGSLSLADGEPMITDAARSGRKHLLSLSLPYSLNVDSMSLDVSDGRLSLKQFVMSLAASIAMPQASDSVSNGRDMLVNATLSTEQWNLRELLALLPASMSDWAQGMDMDADLKLLASINGSMNDSVMPLVDAKLELSKGKFSAPQLLPVALSRIGGALSANLDFSTHPAPSSVTITNLQAFTGKNNIKINGKIDDLLNNFIAQLNLKGSIMLPDIMPFMPDSMPLAMQGRAELDLNAGATLDQIMAVDVEKMKIKGKMAFSDLDVVYDSIELHAPQLSLMLDVDKKKKAAKVSNQLLSASVSGQNVHASMPTSGIDATLEQVNLSAILSNVLDSTAPLDLYCTFDMGSVVAALDSMQASLTNPKGNFSMTVDSKNADKVKYGITYSSEAVSVVLNDSMNVRLAGLSLNGTADHDSTRDNILAQWNPNLNVDFKLGYITVAQLPYVLQIPDIKFQYRPEKCEIASANVVFGNSDYYLSGSVFGLEKWLSHKEMLKGDLYFTSNYTNVDDLLSVFSGMGSSEDSLAQQREEDNVSKEANPFIVPKDVDFTLHTRIKEATAFGNELQELAGDVTVRDGVAVLDQVGFVCKAARMQLTGVYRTPRVNHIFVGLDFHLLDISISELVDMIPMVDTLLPMLTSFEGNANFHLAAETYLNAFYQPKMSTLLGAASISGNNLVVLDSETFDKIAKLMLFKKSTKNVIDSLSVEATAFGREVEIYPFSLTMDKYHLVASGRHTIGRNYDYHLEVLKSPLPTRLAVDLKGLSPLSIKLGPCRYADLFVPERQNSVDKQTMRLKNIIRQSLEANVKQSTIDYEGLK